MAKRNAKRSGRAEHADSSERVTLVVCRGGDCGSRRKHPELDHGAQLDAVRAAVDPSLAEVVPSKCLDACEHSNVFVVMPGEAGRVAGATPVWIGEVNDPAVTHDITSWVNVGGPGVSQAPALAEIQEFRPTRQSRRELEPGQALP